MIICWQNKNKICFFILISFWYSHIVFYLCFVCYVYIYVDQFLNTQHTWTLVVFFAVLLRLVYKILQKETILWSIKFYVCIIYICNKITRNFSAILGYPFCWNFSYNGSIKIVFLFQTKPKATIIALNFFFERYYNNELIILFLFSKLLPSHLVRYHGNKNR